MHNGSKQSEEFLQIIFILLHLLIRGLIKGLNPNKAIFDTFSKEMYHYIVHSGSKPQE